MAEKAAIEGAQGVPRMRSVERISKLPAVEQTVELANSLYGRVKGSSHVVRVVLSRAESTVKGAVGMTLPVTSKLQGPIGAVDSLLCCSLDFVETKVPGVKLPLDEMYRSTRDSLYSIPGVKLACRAGESGVRKAVEMACGARELGTQKLKDVREMLGQGAQEADDGKRSVGAQYSLAAKRLLSLLVSWLWMSKGHLSERRALASGNERKDSEAEGGVKSAGSSGGVSLGGEGEKQAAKQGKSE